MKHNYRMRRASIVILAVATLIVAIWRTPDLWQQVPNSTPASSVIASGPAAEALDMLAVKGRAPKTGYTRAQFGDGWESERGCDTRNIILHRDLTNIVVNSSCQIVSGNLADPYTGKVIVFQRGEASSQAVQIDHVVALSNAWQTGAQQLSTDDRISLANDPLELLAVDGEANQQKSDGDAATWLPPNKVFRCQYVARQIAVKQKYHLWVTDAEKAAMKNVLSLCPDQQLPTAKP